MSARPSGSRARAAAASSTARRGVLGVVEHQQRRSVARGGLGDGRQRRLGDFAAAGVEDRGALALDLGRELGHQPRLADPRRPPDHHADDPALARPAPARAQPVKLALASGEQRRAALELHRQLDDRRRCVEARVLGEDLLLQALELGARLDPDLLDQGLRAPRGRHRAPRTGARRDRGPASAARAGALATAPRRSAPRAGRSPRRGARRRARRRSPARAPAGEAPRAGRSRVRRRARRRRRRAGRRARARARRRPAPFAPAPAGSRAASSTSCSKRRASTAPAGQAQLVAAPAGEDLGLRAALGRAPCAAARRSRWTFLAALAGGSSPQSASISSSALSVVLA